MDGAATCFVLMELIDYWQKKKKIMMMSELIAKESDEVSSAPSKTSLN